MTLQDKPIPDPMLADVLANFKVDVFRTMNAVKIGQIVSFDPAKKTAAIQILFKRVLPDGSIQSYPTLVDCPVVTMQGGLAALQMPIAAGDQCLVLFSDRNIDAWYKTGNQQPPLDGRAHDLTDGIAIVGVNSLASALEDYVAGVVRLFMPTTSGAELTLGTALASLKAQKDDGAAEVLLAAQIVTIKNATTSLLVVLNGLIDVIAAVQANPNIPLTAASIAALNAYKLTIAGLLA